MGTETTTPATDRDSALETFLAGVHGALAARDLAADEAAAVDRVYGALASPGHVGTGVGRRLSVCDACLSEAFANARKHSPGMARIIDAFEAVEQRLSWAPRGAGGPNASESWPGGHANATVVGPGGLEIRADVHVGVSLLAPRVRYPDPGHDPEEVYLVLSPGRFRHGASGWFEPGIGGTLYNAPKVRHAMASDGAPLLAIWLLWTGGAADAS